MSLAETLPQKLADWRPDTPRQTLSLDDPASGWQAEVQAEHVDTVGASLWELRLNRTRPAAEAVPVAEQAQRISRRVTGLLEPLRVVEVDARADTAQLRSQAPTARGDAVQYYEVMRRGDGSTQVQRYQASRSGGRDQVPFNLTHEGLGRLVEGLAD